MTLAPRLSMSAAKRALTRAGLAGGLALAAGACATVPHSVETTPAALALGRPDVTPTHRQEEACATWLFGLIPLGGDAGLASLEDRLNPPEGTALARLTVDRSTAFYLIASQTCTQARATFVERRFVPGLEGEPTSARQAPAGRPGRARPTGPSPTRSSSPKTPPPRPSPSWPPWSTSPSRSTCASAAASVASSPKPTPASSWSSPTPARPGPCGCRTSPRSSASRRDPPPQPGPSTPRWGSPPQSPRPCLPARRLARRPAGRGAPANADPQRLARSLL